MTNYRGIVRDPAYQKNLSEARRETVTVETVYDNGTQYVGVLLTGEGKRYTHTIPKGSTAERVKCEAFGVTNLRDMRGKTLDVYVDEGNIVAARLSERE